MKLNFASPTGVAWSMIVPDGTVVTFDTAGKPSVIPVGLERTYKSSDALKAIVKLLKPKQTVICDVETINQGVDPAIHYGSNLDGSVSMWSTSQVVEPEVVPSGNKGAFVPIFPGISTPELPYGPLHSVPGESDLSVMFRSQIAANNGSPWPREGDDPELDPVYPSALALQQAISLLQYKYVVELDGKKFGVTWAQFGPAVQYKQQPDGSVVRV